MTDKMVSALNTKSGVVGDVPESYLTHPAFKDQLVRVEAGAKNYAPEMYKSKSAEEFSEIHGASDKVAVASKSTKSTEDTNDNEEK